MEEEEVPLYTLEEALTAVGIGKFQYMAMCYAGLGFMAEAFETMILSFIGPALAYQWALSSTQESLISTVVFVGMLIGALFWGFITDTYGRRKGLLSISTVTAVCAALSTFSPNYNCSLAVRMMVGFGVGGGPVYGSWFLEFVPSQNRGMWTIICSAFWTVGTILEALLALMIMPRLGWRDSWDYFISYNGGESWSEIQFGTYVCSVLPIPFTSSCISTACFDYCLAIWCSCFHLWNLPHCGSLLSRDISNISKVNWYRSCKFCGKNWGHAFSYGRVAIGKRVSSNGSNHMFRSCYNFISSQCSAHISRDQREGTN